MRVHVARLVGGDDAEALPDGAKRVHAPAQVDELPERALLAQEALDARARVDDRIDADDERRRTGSRAAGHALKRLPNLAGDDRALMVAVAVKERDEDNALAEVLGADGLTTHHIGEPEARQADARRRLTAAIVTRGRGLGHRLSR